MPEFELSFQKMIDDTAFIANRKYWNFYDPLSRYTIELLHDEYDIPDKYVNSTNNIFGSKKIIKMIVKHYDLSFIKKISKYQNKNYILYVTWYAAVFGRINILEWVRDEHEMNANIIAAAAKRNQMETLQWLINNGYSVIDETIQNSAKNGLTDVFRFLIKQKNNVEDLGYYAALSGQMDIIEFIYSIDPKLLSGIARGAMEIGNITIFKFACDNGYMEDIQYNINLVSLLKCQSAEIFSLFLDNYYIQKDSNIFYEPLRNLSASCIAAGSGIFECLQMVHSKKYLISCSLIFASAVKNCDIVMMKFLNNLNCDMDDESIITFIHAFFSKKRRVGKKSLTNAEFWDVIGLLESWGCKWDGVCKAAASVGELEVLKYAHERGCPLTANVIYAAALNGYLHIVIWLRENNCEWAAEMCSACIPNNDTNMLKWLRNCNDYRSSCGLPSTETEIYPWDEDFVISAIHEDNIMMLKFAVENGYECPDISNIEIYNPEFNEYVKSLIHETH